MISSTPIECISVCLPFPRQIVVKNPKTLLLLMRYLLSIIPESIPEALDSFYATRYLTNRSHRHKTNDRH